MYRFYSLVGRGLIFIFYIAVFDGFLERFFFCFLDSKYRVVRANVGRG